LGPIYINDLVDSYGSYCDMYIFADDAKFYRHIEHTEDQESMQLVSNKCITSVVKEMAVNLLSLNSNKCLVVSYGRTITNLYFTKQW